MTFGIFHWGVCTGKFPGPLGAGPFSEIIWNPTYRRLCPSAQPVNTPGTATIALNAMLRSPTMIMVPGTSPVISLVGVRGITGGLEHGPGEGEQCRGQVHVLVSHRCFRLHLCQAGGEVEVEPPVPGPEALRLRGLGVPHQPEPVAGWCGSFFLCFTQFHT